MTFEPQKLFIGLMDFFTILMPGALLTFVLKDGVGPEALGSLGLGLVDAQGWVAFAFVSYLLGHLVFLISSWLDIAYDLVRGCTLDTQIALLAQRDQLLPRWRRAAIWLIFKRDRNLPMQQATRLREAFFKNFGADGAINTFQWCKIYLGLKRSPSLATIQRLEADSKFFRSFAIVMILIICFWPEHVNWPWPGITIVVSLMLLAAWRYMEQRFKAIRQAYWSAITHAADDRDLQPEAASLVGGTAAWAGGVVFRVRDGQVEYLLVEAKDRRDHWVLPMAPIEADELLLEAAIRAAHHESGIWAMIGGMRLPKSGLLTAAAADIRRTRIKDAELGKKTFIIKGRPIEAHFFLMGAVGSGLSADWRRRCQWLSLEDAKALSNHDETRDLLHEANARYSSIQQPSEDVAKAGAPLSA